MKYQAYPAYKDSGVEWLGEVPEHWEVKKVKYIGQAIIGLTYSPNDIVDSDGIIVLRSTNLQESKIDLSNIVCVKTKVSEKLILKHGDILICSRNGSRNLIGKNALISEKEAGLTFGAFTTVLRTKYFRFLYCILNSPLFDYQAGMFLTTTINQLTTETLNNFEIPFPSIQEQTAIANFLERETRRIDELSKEKERFIELLKEKRQALISHAVTKGLNPTVKMKKSGIEWLGEIPEHWIKTPIKYVLKGIIDTEHKTVTFFDEGEYLVVRTTNIKNGKLLFDGAKYTDYAGYVEWTKRGKPQSGDIMFTREAPAGEACLVPKEINLCMGQRTVLLQVNHNLLESNYGLFSIYGGLAAEFIQALSQGTTVIHFNMSDINNIPILLPPIEEQTQIANYLDQQTAKIDALISETQNSINLLKEHRAALISAAVTGKIDIREYT